MKEVEVVYRDIADDGKEARLAAKERELAEKERLINEKIKIIRRTSRIYTNSIK